MNWEIKDEVKLTEPTNEMEGFKKMHETFLKEYERLGCGMFEDTCGHPKYWTISSVIRNLINLGLTYMVFRETGGWTAFVCFLFLMYVEAQTYINAVNRYRWTKVLRVQIDNKKDTLTSLYKIVTFKLQQQKNKEKAEQRLKEQENTKNT